ncbi:MAG: transposase [Roseiarcus sp.]
MVAENFEEGVRACHVARRHGLTPQQLFTWRREARRTAEEETDAPPFVPAIVEAPSGATTPTPQAESKAAAAHRRSSADVAPPARAPRPTLRQRQARTQIAPQPRPPSTALAPYDTKRIIAVASDHGAGRHGKPERLPRSSPRQSPPFLSPFTRGVGQRQRKSQSVSRELHPPTRAYALKSICIGAPQRSEYRR